MLRSVPSVPLGARRRRVAALALLLLPAVASAQERKWIAIDAFPPGSPAEVNFLPGPSSTQESFFELRIHGFWLWDDVGDDGSVYQRVDFPGLAPIGQTGAPELPALRARLAIVTTAAEARLQGVDPTSPFALPGVVIHPQPILGEDEEIDPSEDPGEGDVDGSDEVFVKDADIYGGGQAWPSGFGVEAAPTEADVLGPVDGALCELWPVSWNPDDKLLSVWAEVLYHVVHPGATALPADLSRDFGPLLDATFANATEVGPLVLDVLGPFHSRYLIVAPPGFEDDVQSFAFHKKLLGFETTVETVASMNWWDVREQIANWFLLGDAGVGHYCLLVGDTNRIPTGTFGVDQTPTDDYYGSPLDLDQDEEIFVGRVSFDDADDLARQLAKIKDYELSPVPGGRYDRALLVAHKQGSPGKYEGAHEAVANFPYAAPPWFLYQYGA